ncbi:hypothetical protein B0H11DRAFT_1163161 [Mycena galericulata]|nr:hypothetical protein B0H11DRAFT_1163161 [Mycena galericulata]
MQRNLVVAAAMEDLWPRLWFWIQFQDRYAGLHPRESLSGALTMDYGEPTATNSTHLATLRICTLVGSGSHGENIPNSAVAATPGVALFVMRLWVRWLHDEHVRETSKGCMALLLHYFIHAAGPNFTQILEVVGGTILDFASLLIKHINIIISDLRLGGHPELDISEFCLFLHDVTASQYSADLAMVGLTKPLVRSALSLWPIHKDIVLRLLVSLHNILWAAPLYPWVAEALDAGLLTVLSRWGIDGGYENEYTHDFLRNILRVILPCQLVYYSILRRVEKVDHVSLIPLLQHEGIRRDWQRLWDLIAERLSVKARFDIRRISTKFCDNMVCKTVGPKTGFLRCSHCSTTYYCSKACQATHWRFGGHRAVCHRSGPKGGEELTTKQMSFIRYVVHHDYLARKDEILTLRAAFMRSSAHPFYTEFDYTHGELGLTVLPTKNLPPLLSSATAKSQWIDLVYRMACSSGRMTLDVAVVQMGHATPRYCVFPMRSNRSDIHDGLCAIIDAHRAAKTSSKEYATALRSLAEDRCDDLLEVHL